MAERRMFSKRIISSARFLRMPASAQALYLHLVMNADDEGIVEAFSVMRLAAANEEDLKELAEHKFIRILNDDFVAHILDWDENNKIRPDRKKESLYKDLLEEDKTEEETNFTTDEKPSNDATAADCGQVSADCPTSDGQLSTDCGQVSADCPHRLGKVRLGKVRLKKHNAQPRAREAQKTKRASPSLSDYTKNEALSEALAGFVEMRRKIKAPLTDRALTLALSQLDKLAKSDEEKIAIVNQTVMNGWKGFYALKQEVNQRGNTGINRRTAKDEDRYADFREADRRQIYPWEVQSQPGSAGTVSGVHSPSGGSAGEVPELPGKVLAGGEPSRGDPCPDDCGRPGDGSRGNLQMGAPAPGTGTNQSARSIGPSADGVCAGHLSGLPPDAGECGSG